MENPPVSDRYTIFPRTNPFGTVFQYDSRFGITFYILLVPADINERHTRFHGLSIFVDLLIDYRIFKDIAAPDLTSFRPTSFSFAMTEAIFEAANVYQAFDVFWNFIVNDTKTMKK
mmetsp:Transcript_19936/g.35058  ORF Transcript_19936/g.35058 Transcript_19936/m.35058 type:complete len:116 (-) Transcript_19936:439-786(-)